MTRPDLKAIKARAAAATPGPWAVVDDAGMGVVSLGDVRATEMVVAMAPKVSHANMGFIAAAREDIPALCDYIDSLPADLDLILATHAPIVDQRDRFADRVDRLEAALRLALEALNVESPANWALKHRAMEAGRTALADADSSAKAGSWDADGAEVGRG